MLDWHITCLSYCTHSVNLKALGEEEYRKKQSLTFYAPFQYPKEVHKNVKMLDTDFIDRMLFNGEDRDLSLADIFIFNELMTLNLMGQNLQKYPRVVLYLKDLASRYEELRSSLNSLEAYVKINGHEFYLGEAGFGESLPRL